MIKPDIKSILADKSVDDKVIETYKRLSVFSDADDRQKWYNNRKKNRDLIDKNELWENNEEKAMTDEGMVPLVINDAVDGVRGASAIATDNKPGIHAKPIGGGDLYVSELLQRGFDYVWRSNNGNGVIYKAVVECKGGGGLAGFHVFHDPHKGIFGKIQLKYLKPTRIYFSDDSEEEDFSDSDILLAQLRTRKYVLENYDIKEDDLVFQTEVSDKPQTSTGIEGVDNYAIGENERESLKTEQKSVWEIEHWILKTVTEPWVVIKEKDTFRPIRLEGKNEKKAIEKLRKKNSLLPLGGNYIWKRKLQKRVLRIVVGKKMISEVTDPYGMDKDGEPITGIIGLKHWDTDTAYSSCPTTFARPLVKERSKRRAQSILAVSKDLRSPIVRTDDTREKKGDIIVDKNTPAHAMPYRLGSPNINFSGALNLEQLAKEGVDGHYDMQDVMKGKMPPGERAPSGRVVLALQDSAGMMSRPFTRKLESSIVRVGKIVFVLMLKHWPQELWSQLIDKEDWLMWSPEGKRDEEDPEIKRKWMDALERIRPRDMDKPPGYQLIDLDVGIEAGSLLPTNRVGKLEFAMAMGELGWYDAEAGLTFVDDPEKDKILRRLRAREAAAQEFEIAKGAK